MAIQANSASGAFAVVGLFLWGFLQEKAKSSYKDMLQALCNSHHLGHGKHTEGKEVRANCVC